MKRSNGATGSPSSSSDILVSCIKTTYPSFSHPYLFVDSLFCLFNYKEAWSHRKMFWFYFNRFINCFKELNIFIFKKHICYYDCDQHFKYWSSTQKTSAASECMCVEKGNARKIHSQAHLLSCFGFSFLFGNRDKLLHWL